MDELAKRFADLAQKFGPQVVDAALGAVRVEMYSTLAFLVVDLGATAFLVWLSLFMRKRTDVVHADDRWLVIAASFIPLVAASFFGAHLLWTLIDPWTWTAISHPELWIAKRALGL